MSADRETNHDMTNSDIAVLLADATDEVEIGIAPYQAVIRGGRRRRARRWAVAAATALVLAGSSATLAVAGLRGGDGGRMESTATRPPSSPDMFKPQRITLGSGTENGRKWRVVLDVWAAPRSEAEARAQLRAQARWETGPIQTTLESRPPGALVGRYAYFLHRGFGEVDSMATKLMVPYVRPLPATGVEAQPVDLEEDAEGPSRVVVGQVDKTAQRVTCTWKDGTTTEIRRAPSNNGTSSEELAIRTVEGAPFDWFVCVAPEGTSYKSAEVTK